VHGERREGGESDCCPQEPAALVEHGYYWITWSAR